VCDCVFVYLYAACLFVCVLLPTWRINVSVNERVPDIKAVRVGTAFVCDLQTTIYVHERKRRRTERRLSQSQNQRSPSCIQGITSARSYCSAMLNADVTDCLPTGSKTRLHFKCQSIKNDFKSPLLPGQLNENKNNYSNNTFNTHTQY